MYYVTLIYIHKVTESLYTLQRRVPFYGVIVTSILLLGILSSTYAVDVYKAYNEKLNDGGDGLLLFDGSQLQKVEVWHNLLFKLRKTIIIQILDDNKIVIPENNRDLDTLTKDQAYQNLSDNEILYTVDNNWNPHKVGLSSSIWNASFTENATLTIHNSHNENGHVAMGIWWHEFPSKSRIPLDETEVTVELDITLHQIEYNPDDSFLRIALASAILDDTGNVWYTEIDLWDSPVTDELPENPNLIHVSNEVVEFKFCQISTGETIHLTIPLSDYIHAAWDSRVDSANLESIYIVIESLEEYHNSEDYAEISVNNFLVNFHG